MKIDNELIAEFMGLTFSQEYESYNETYFYYKPETDGIWFRTLDDETEDNPYVKVNGKRAVDYHYRLQYDTSWDWLMPVVEKIKNDGHYVQVTLAAENAIITISYKDSQSVFGAWVQRIKIESTDPLIIVYYKAIVEFLKWYNSQNSAHSFTEGSDL